mmetsp:Transcript_67534/g.151681  ORF Transcript_67534/g.151681 Transcript_67534/m.151681 type:complete len:264 (+) Transcript_67534:373-1164(+)
MCELVKSLADVSACGGNGALRGLRVGNETPLQLLCIEKLSAKTLDHLLYPLSMPLDERPGGQLIVVALVRMHGALVADEGVAILTKQLIATGPVDAAVLRSVHCLHARQACALLCEPMQGVSHGGLCTLVLSCTTPAEVHGAVLTIGLRSVATDTLLALEVGLCDLIAVNLGQHFKVRQVLVQACLFLATARAKGALEFIPMRIERALEAGATHAVEAGQHLYLLAAIDEGCVWEAAAAQGAACIPSPHPPHIRKLEQIALTQ